MPLVRSGVPGRRPFASVVGSPPSCLNVFVTLAAFASTDSSKFVFSDGFASAGLLEPSPSPTSPTAASPSPSPSPSPASPSPSPVSASPSPSPDSPSPACPSSPSTASASPASSSSSSPDVSTIDRFGVSILNVSDENILEVMRPYPIIDSSVYGRFPFVKTSFDNASINSSNPFPNA